MADLADGQMMRYVSPYGSGIMSLDLLSNVWCWFWYGFHGNKAMQQYGVYLGVAGFGETDSGITGEEET